MSPFEADPQNPRVFAPVWQCIYCGANDNPDSLSKEHIIPYGLNGSLLLPRASCSVCAGVTRDFEAVCLRDMLQQFRTHTNMQSRKKSHPKNLPINVTRNGERRREFVPIESHPLVLVLPVFEPAALLIGRDPFIITQKTGAMMWRDEEEFRRRLKLHGNKENDVAVQTAFNPKPFGRMLAKIAHAFSVAIFGNGSFKPLVIDAILGGKSHYTNWVGGAAFPLTGKGLHLLDAALITSKFGTRYISVRICLFPEYGMPTYEVLVGEPIPGMEHKLTDPQGFKAPMHNSGRKPTVS